MNDNMAYVSVMLSQTESLKPTSNHPFHDFLIRAETSPPTLMNSSEQITTRLPISIRKRHLTVPLRSRNTPSSDMNTKSILHYTLRVDGTLASPDSPDMVERVCVKRRVEREKHSSMTMLMFNK